LDLGCFTFLMYFNITKVLHAGGRLGKRFPAILEGSGTGVLPTGWLAPDLGLALR